MSDLSNTSLKGFWSWIMYTLMRKIHTENKKNSFTGDIMQKIGLWLQYLRFLYDSAGTGIPDTTGITDMNVSIDRMACVSCGACWNLCPELFDQNHCDSFSEVVEDYRFNGTGQRGLCRTASAAVHRKQRIFARYRSSVSARASPYFFSPVPLSEIKNR